MPSLGISDDPKEQYDDWKWEDRQLALEEKAEKEKWEALWFKGRKPHHHLPC